ncbi:hypothetical protein JKP88DRAFT_304568 [Tribonema minus]|uniref:Nuclear envelope membrane protein n=1 Tax=Tribonema minus TaxID=303371 RepID=A0A836CKB2_9STRA|nr:hypothetical protein JKP88DRAFT_304568 [Tribonema minus]
MPGGAPRAMLAAFGIASYALQMYGICLLIAFNGNLVHYFPAIDPFLPFAVDGSAWNDSNWFGKATIHKLLGDEYGHGSDHSLLKAAMFDLLLIAVFAIPHSILPRLGVKEAMRKTIPEAAERSIYGLQAAVLLITLVALWQPIDAPVIWQAPSWAHAPLLALQAAGVAFAVSSTFAIDHFHLFGIRQALSHPLTTKHLPPPHLQTHWHYHLMRHPLAAGLVVSWFAQPVMTAGHLLLAIAFTLYQTLAIVCLEERDLHTIFGSQWDAYERRVPAFGVHAAALCPVLTRRGKGAAPSDSASEHATAARGASGVKASESGAAQRAAPVHSVSSSKKIG